MIVEDSRTLPVDFPWKMSSIAKTGKCDRSFCGISDQEQSFSTNFSNLQALSDEVLKHKSCKLRNRVEFELCGTTVT